MYVTNVKPEVVTQTVTQQIKKSKTEVKVNVFTGVKTTVTDEPERINTSENQVIIQNVIQQRDDLKDFTVQGLVVKEFENTKE